MVMLVVQSLGVITVPKHSWLTNTQTTCMWPHEFVKDSRMLLTCFPCQCTGAGCSPSITQFEPFTATPGHSTPFTFFWLLATQMHHSETQNLHLLFLRSTMVPSLIQSQKETEEEQLFIHFSSAILTLLLAFLSLPLCCRFKYSCNQIRTLQPSSYLLTSFLPPQ